MKLPQAKDGRVPQAKTTDYLLNPHHEKGGSKAKFFLDFGFRRDRPDELIAALRAHADENHVSDVRQLKEGLSYGVEGPMDCPNGRRPNVRSVWLIESGQTPRLLTAYPA